MDRRQFLYAAATLPTLAAAIYASDHLNRPADLTAHEFQASRKFVGLSESRRIAYVEKGSGPAALFLHGRPRSGDGGRGARARRAGGRRGGAPGGGGAGAAGGAGGA